MKIVSKSAFTGLAALFFVVAQPVSAGSTSWTEFANTGVAPAANAQPTPAVSAINGVNVYLDPVVFGNTFPNLTSEDFSGTLVPANGVGSCAGPINNTVGPPPCFNPGALVAGFSMDAQNAPDPNASIVVLTPAFLGITSVAVGPNNFAADTVLDFVAPNNTIAFDLVSPLADPADYVIEVFASNGSSMGTIVHPGTLAGTFIGLSSTQGISRIIVTNAAGNGELFSNLQFGNVVFATPVDVPVMSNIALIALVLALMMVGMTLVRRKHNA